MIVEQPLRGCEELVMIDGIGHSAVSSCILSRIARERELHVSKDL